MLTDTHHVADGRVKVDAATQLRDNLDVFTNLPSYGIFLKRVMPVFFSILNGPCIFQSNSNEQVQRPPTHVMVLMFQAGAHRLDPSFIWR